MINSTALTAHTPLGNPANCLLRSDADIQGDLHSRVAQGKLFIKEDCLPNRPGKAIQDPPACAIWRLQAFMDNPNGQFIGDEVSFGDVAVGFLTSGEPEATASE